MIGCGRCKSVSEPGPGEEMGVWDSGFLSFCFIQFSLGSHRLICHNPQITAVFSHFCQFSVLFCRLRSEASCLTVSIMIPQSDNYFPMGSQSDAYLFANVCLSFFAVRCLFFAGQGNIFARLHEEVFNFCRRSAVNW